jgi:hypothetical protein
MAFTFVAHPTRMYLPLFENSREVIKIGGRGFATLSSPGSSIVTHANGFYEPVSTVRDPVE